MKRLIRVGALLSAALLCACASDPKPAGPLPPLALAAQVDIPRFMGDWHVIAGILTPFEKGAHGALEQYRLNDDGTVATLFSFNAGGFDGPRREFHSKGFVDPSNPAIWGQQYVWPIKADYRIAWVAPDYSQTVVARQQRDYVWILSRTPTISEADLARLLRFIGEQGYDTTRVQRVPQAAVPR